MCTIRTYALELIYKNFQKICPTSWENSNLVGVHTKHTYIKNFESALNQLILRVSSFTKIYGLYIIQRTLRVELPL